MPGAADWNTPTSATAYLTVLDNLNDKLVDAISLQKSAPSNLPTGAIKYDRINNKFQEWSGAAFVDLLLSVAGGGTGSASAAGARTNLGLGTMAVQNANAVAITAGTIAGDGSGLTNLNATNLASGTVATARLGSGVASATTFLRGDSSWQVVQTVVPYGVDKVAGFAAAVETIYNCSGPFTVTLPTVVGNGGKRVGIVKKTNASLTITASVGETIKGALSWTFDDDIYSTVMLTADANGNKWDIF